MNTFSKGITKEELLEEIKKHREADMILQGTYGAKMTLTILSKNSISRSKSWSSSRSTI